MAGRRTSSAVSASATPVQPDTPGSISLSPNPPQAGGQMTATLSDADGSISRVLWSWTYFGATGSSDETGDETATGSAETATTATRTISILRTKVGYSIRVSASYTDGYGSGRRAQSAQSLPITAPPPVVCSLSSLSATAGNGQVSLSWSAPSGSNCATVTGYAYRYKASGRELVFLDQHRHGDEPDGVGLDQRHDLLLRGACGHRSRHQRGGCRRRPRPGHRHPRRR